MAKVNAVITGVGGYVPDYILTNEELSRMVDTSDEWIRTRVGIRERRILTEEGLGASYMARKACKQLLKKTGVDPDSIEALIVSTTTPDYPFPSTASIVVGKLGLKNAFAFDMSCACCGFIYALDMASSMIQSGRYKKVIVCSAEKMSSIVDWTDRQTCVLFGDGAGAVLLEATEEEGVGFQDSMLLTDGKGLPFLHMKATVMKRNGLDNTNLNWIIPHEANLRIIDAVAKRAELPLDKVVINIDHYGNTSSATIPLALWDNEANFKKGDNIIFTAFGAGFVHGAIYYKWGYDGDKVGKGE